VAGNGTAAYSGDNGPAASASLNYPSGVSVDVLGNIYIADTDNNRIRKVDVLSGKIATVAGNGTAGYSGDGGVATSAKIYYPAGVSIDTSGNLFIADTYNNRIRKVAAAPSIIVTDPIAPVYDLQMPFGSVTGHYIRSNGHRNQQRQCKPCHRHNWRQTHWRRRSLQLGNCSGRPCACIRLPLTVHSRRQQLEHSNSFDIPSNDPISATVTVNVSGTGTEMPVPITVTILSV
jgi:hypothetical protein